MAGHEVQRGNDGVKVGHVSTERDIPRRSVVTQKKAALYLAWIFVFCLDFIGFIENLQILTVVGMPPAFGKCT